MKNRVLLISGISALAGGIAWYFINRSKQANRLQPSVNQGSHVDGESMIHRIMHKSRMKAGS